jgi:hypothetical protein
MAEEAARRALTRALAALALAATVLTAGAAPPQQVAPPQQAAHPQQKSKPVWAELTATQQQILDPLKADWDQLSTSRKQNWIGIAKRYPGMKPEEQKRVKERMQSWAKLTPEQRRVARERYKSIGKLPPENRQQLQQQWAEYQALPPGEKRMLDTPPVNRASERRKPKAATPPPSQRKQSTPQGWP